MLSPPCPSCCFTSTPSTCSPDLMDRSHRSRLCCLALGYCRGTGAPLKPQQHQGEPCAEAGMCCVGAVLPWELSPLGKGDFGDRMVLGVVLPWFRRSQHRAYLWWRNLTLKDACAKAMGLVAEGLNPHACPTEHGAVTWALGCCSFPPAAAGTGQRQEALPAALLCFSQ